MAISKLVNVRGRTRPISWCALVVGAIVGCRDASPPQVTQAEPTSTPVAVAAIGTVGGIPISDSDFQDALRFAPENVEEALRTAAGLALLGKEAERLQASQSGSWMTGLQFLEASVAPSQVCRNIPERQLREHYQRDKKTYVHPDVFHVEDAQIVCCTTPQKGCGEPLALEGCLENGSRVLHSLRTQLETTPNSKTSLRDAIAPKEVGVRTYRFAYDYGKEREEQGGTWLVLEPAILEGVRSRKAGEMVGPIRTAYGIHLLRILEHKAPSNRLFEEPEVQKSLHEKVCKQTKEQMRRQFLTDILHGKTIGPVTHAAREAWNAHRTQSGDRP